MFCFWKDTQCSGSLAWNWKYIWACCSLNTPTLPRVTKKHLSVDSSVLVHSCTYCTSVLAKDTIHSQKNTLIPQELFEWILLGTFFWKKKHSVLRFDIECQKVPLRDKPKKCHVTVLFCEFKRKIVLFGIFILFSRLFRLNYKNLLTIIFAWPFSNLITQCGLEPKTRRI